MTLIIFSLSLLSVGNLSYICIIFKIYILMVHYNIVATYSDGTNTFTSVSTVFTAVSALRNAKCIGRSLNSDSSVEAVDVEIMRVHTDGIHVSKTLYYKCLFSKDCDLRKYSIMSLYRSRPLSPKKRYYAE